MASLLIKAFLGSEAASLQSCCSAPPGLMSGFENCNILQGRLPPRDAVVAKVLAQISYNAFSMHYS